MEAAMATPSSSRIWRSSRCRPRARKMLVVKFSCSSQFVMVLRPRNDSAQRFISVATCRGYGQKQRVFVNGQFQVSLVIERHGRDLPQGIFAIKHPAIGPRQQGVGYVSDAVLDAGHWVWLPDRYPVSTAAADRPE